MSLETSKLFDGLKIFPTKVEHFKLPPAWLLRSDGRWFDLGEIVWYQTSKVLILDITCEDGFNILLFVKCLISGTISKIKSVNTKKIIREF